MIGHCCSFMRPTSPTWMSGHFIARVDIDSIWTDKRFRSNNVKNWLPKLKIFDFFKNWLTLYKLPRDDCDRLSLIQLKQYIKILVTLSDVSADLNMVALNRPLQFTYVIIVSLVIYRVDQNFGNALVCWLRVSWWKERIFSLLKWKIYSIASKWHQFFCAWCHD